MPVTEIYILVPHLLRCVLWFAREKKNIKRFPCISSGVTDPWIWYGPLVSKQVHDWESEWMNGWLMDGNQAYVSLVGTFASCVWPTAVAMFPVELSECVLLVVDLTADSGNTLFRVLNGGRDGYLSPSDGRKMPPYAGPAGLVTIGDKPTPACWH